MPEAHELQGEEAHFQSSVPELTPNLESLSLDKVAERNYSQHKITWLDAKEAAEKIPEIESTIEQQKREADSLEKYIKFANSPLERAAVGAVREMIGRSITSETLEKDRLYKKANPDSTGEETRNIKEAQLHVQHNIEAYENSAAMDYMRAREADPERYPEPLHLGNPENITPLSLARDQLSDALKLAESMTKYQDNDYAIALPLIIRTAVKGGELDKAFEIANAIKSPAIRSKAYSMIAQETKDKDALDKSVDAARSIQDKTEGFLGRSEFFKNEALEEAGIVAAGLGDISRAINIANTDGLGEENKDRVLTAVVRVQVQSGDMQAALSTLNYLDDRSRGVALSFIVKSAEDADVYNQVMEEAEKLDEGERTVVMIAALGRHPELFDQTMELVKQESYPSIRVQQLLDIYEVTQHDDLLIQAKAAADLIDSPVDKARVIARIACVAHDPDMKARLREEAWAFDGFVSNSRNRISSDVAIENVEAGHIEPALQAAEDMPATESGIIEKMKILNAIFDREKTL